MADWQPIESVPKDGTVVLLHLSRASLCGYASVHRPMKAIGIGCFNGNYWEYGVPGGRSLGGDDNQFTHWMPRPDPPQITEHQPEGE